MREYNRPGGLDPERTTDLDEPDTQEIRVEIEQTRTEMSGTLDAIQQRLSPDTLTEQAKDVARDAADQAKVAAQEVLKDAVREVKDAALQVTEHAVQEVKEAARDVTGQAKDAAWDATVGRAEEAVSSAGETARGVGSIVFDTIKANPIPAALAGASLYWLYTKRSGSSSTSASYGRSPYPPQQAYPVRPTYGASSYGTTYETTGYDSRRTTSGTQGQGGQSTVGAIGDTVSGAASQVGDVASDVASSAGRLASDAASTAGQYASSAVSTAGQYASTAGETALDTGSDVIGLIRANPIPAAMIGLGLGWLYMNRSSGGPDYRARSGDHYRYPPEARYGASGSSYGSGSYGSGTYGSGSYGSSSSQGGVGDTARQAGSQVSDLASQAGSQVSSLASGVQEQAGDLAEAVVDRTKRAPGQIQRMIEDNPLLTAALAATVGAAAGLALPPTQTEDQLVGKSRDQLMGKAQQAASDAVDKVQGIAEEVQHTATREAQAQGLTVDRAATR